jgi:hypothetical protein
LFGSAACKLQLFEMKLVFWAAPGDWPLVMSTFGLLKLFKSPLFGGVDEKSNAEVLVG